MAVSPVRGEWPLCGRETEFRDFRRFLAGEGCDAVVLAGAAGVGKTYFAGHCLSFARRSGYTVVEMVGTKAAAGLPFGAFAHLLPAREHGQDGAVDRPADLFRRLAASLIERAGPKGLVLSVDDAHMLDGASAALVRHLVANRLVFVLATIRSAAPTPDAITWLWKEQHAERIELRGLGDDAVAQLLPKVLGGSMDPAAIATLTDRSSGNMLFLRELIYGALDSGTLRQEHGIWRLTGPLAPSQRLSELIEIRLETLSPAQRELLEVVSFGEPLGPAEISTLGDLATAADLERMRLLRTSSVGGRLEFRLAHPLYGDVIRATTPGIRAATIAAALADSVERTGARRREDALRIATWRLDAGGGSPELMLTVARQARWRYDFPLAERLARAAADTGGGFEARLLVAELTQLQGRAEEAEPLFAQLYREADDDCRRARVTFHQIDNLGIYQGRLSEALRIAEDAERVISDPDARAEVMAKRSTIVLGLQGPRSAAELVEQLLTEAKGKALVWSCTIGAYAFGRAGQIDRALAIAERGHKAHVELTEPFEWYPWIHQFFRCEAETYAGRFQDSEKLAQAEHQLALVEHSEEAQAYFAFQLARIAVRRGHMAAAVDRAREAAALFGSLGRRTFEQSSVALLATALAALGRSKEAAEAFAVSERISEATGPQMWPYPVDVIEARAWVAAGQGEVQVAFEHLATARELARSSGDRFGEASVLSACARLGRAEEVRTRLEELGAQFDGPLVPGLAAHAAAVAEGDAVALDGLSESFEAMGAPLLAAECAAEASTLWRQHSCDRAADLAEQRVAMLAQACGEVTTPSLAKIWDRSRLSPTELQICLLAQSGRSNKAIADELFLSVRTVGNHLHHAYHKLGISGRKELDLS